MSAAYVGQIERGTRDPGLGALSRLADALGVSLAAVVSSEPSTPLAEDVAALSPEGQQVVRVLVAELAAWEARYPGNPKSRDREP